MTLNRGILGLLAVALAAWFSWWGYRTAVEQARPATRPASSGPDAFMEAMVLSTLDRQGRLRHRLWAESARHYPQGDRTELERPRMAFYRNGRPGWRVEAARGVLLAGGDEVRLAGGVDFRHPGGDGRLPARGETDHLRLWPPRDYAETDAAVSYTNPRLRVNAVGLQAWLAKDRLRLRSQVHARYLPREARP